MNCNRQTEVHYINTGFPYAVTESFMDLFEGLTYAQADVALAQALQDQGNPYWSMMHTSSYKYGFSASGSNSYYNFSHAYEVNDYAPRLEGGRRAWDNSAPLNNADLPHIVMDEDRGVDPSTEECKLDQAYLTVIYKFYVLTCGNRTDEVDFWRSLAQKIVLSKSFNRTVAILDK